MSVQRNPKQLDLFMPFVESSIYMNNPCSEETLTEVLNSHRQRRSIETPFTKDISAGKNTYVYDAHTYHTKVPPQGIAHLISYYTNPGEVVLDPFCGSGMTGVAALEADRQAILSDLSPAATFIAENFCTPIDDVEFIAAANQILDSSLELQQKLYSTACRTCRKLVPLLYMVWSYGLICNKCNQEFILWDVARDERKNVRESKIKKEFNCPHCKSQITKRSLKRTKHYPVQIGYKCCGKGNKEQNAIPNQDDLAVIELIEKTGLPEDLWYPTNEFPLGVNTRQPIAAGINTVDKAYTRRSLWAMAHLWKQATNHPSAAVRKKLLFTLTSLYQRVTIFSEFRFWGGSGNTANYNVPQIMNEQNVFATFRRKASTISWYFRAAPRIPRRFYISTRSACDLSHLPDESIDFVFTDPPFGSNINYSEMNFLWESWLCQFTDIAEEAIVSKAQNKTIDDYQFLLCRAFLEIHRVLRADGWMCIVFHNSSEKVWKALQRAIMNSGFDVKAAQTFDKQHGTFKMFVSNNSVGYDLVLHCKKRPSESNSESDTVTQLVKGSLNTVNTVREFIRKQLKEGNSYQVQYVHVARETEFDYRRLYAEWLCLSFAHTEINMDFETFRKITIEILKERTRG